MKKTTATLTATLGLVLGSLHAQTVPPFINTTKARLLTVRAWV